MGKINVQREKWKNSWRKKKWRWICYEKTNNMHRMYKYNNIKGGENNVVNIDILQ